MANRHLARSIALQSLFEWDFHTYPASRIKDIIAYNKQEFAPGLADDAYILHLIEGVLKKQNTLDAIIKKAAPEWPLEKISLVDRNVLRAGLYELLFGDRKEVPPKVAINEAIELAKAFGGENSGKFVNGVMGTVYKEIGEPGKDDTSPKHITDPARMPREYLGGAVVYKEDEGGIYLAFVHDVFGYWTLSKGHVEEGEDVETGTRREVKEELGIDIELVGQIGENEYTASDPERGKIRKNVKYFLGRALSDKLHFEKKGGLTDAQWFPLSQVADLKVYGDILPIITKGVRVILDRAGGKDAS